MNTEILRRLGNFLSAKYSQSKAARLVLIAAVILLPLKESYARNGTELINKTKNLRFIENNGQVIDQNNRQRSDINFKVAAHEGLNIFIGNGSIHYQWARPLRTERPLQRGQGKYAGQVSSISQSYELYRMDVTLIGANPRAQIEVKGKGRYYEQYYLGFMKAGVKSYSYQEITYRNIYPNIDWTLYVNKNGKIEYDFTIRPGGNVADIQLKFSGNSSLRLSEDGGIIAATPMGSIAEEAPYSFLSNGDPIKSCFKLNGNILSFDVKEPYTGTLTIDPTLEWATYYGGSGSDLGRAVACDAKGDIYMTGSVSSVSNIATVGAHQTTYGGGTNDAFLAKFDSSGACLWATYYGGNGDDQGWSVSCDEADNVYLCGQTTSTNNIASKGFKGLNSGGEDAFLVKFTPLGSLLWSTYYGGGKNDEGWALASDGDGSIYMAGRTFSDTGIATANTHQQGYSNASDAFIVKFDTAGNRLWGTYYGGSGDENTWDLVCDSTGNVYISGETFSDTGIATPNAYQGTMTGANGSESFLAKFNRKGILKWGTYYGGNQPGQVFGTSVACDDSNAVYMTGYTVSTVGIATTGSFQSVNGGGYDAFLVKFDSVGHRQWGTYYGGSSLENSYGVACDRRGNVYITGYTESKEKIATTGSIQGSLAAGQDFFVAKFNRQGAIQWGTYYGAGGYDAGFSIAHDRKGSLYVTGFTNSGGLSTANAFQPTQGGGFDGLLIRISECFIATPASIDGPDSICPNTTAAYHIPQVDGADGYVWQLPAGWTGNSTTDSIIVTTNDQNGTISVFAVNSCDSSIVVRKDVAVYQMEFPVINVSGFTLSTVASYATYQWLLNGNAISGATNSTYAVHANGDYQVIVTNNAGCMDTSDIYKVNNAGIEDRSALATSIRVYPNPATERITIQSPVKVDVALTDVTGRTIKQAKQAGSVNISNLASGLYLLRISLQDGTLIKVEKVVKQEP